MPDPSFSNLRLPGRAFPFFSQPDTLYEDRPTTSVGGNTPAKLPFNQQPFQHSWTLFSPPSCKYPEITGPSSTVLRRACSPPNPILSKRPATNSLRPTTRSTAASRSSRSSRGLSRGAGSRGGTSGSAFMQITGEGDEKQIIFRSGNKYVGNLLANKPHSWGTYWIARPSTTAGKPGSKKPAQSWRLQYEGDWFQGKRHGKGTLYYRSGECYKGDFVLDRCHGMGQYTYANGDVHYGEWYNGRKQGKGVLVTKGRRCNVFKGFWSEDAREGLGTIFWTDSMYKYVGEWVRDQVRCGEVKPARAQELVDALSGLPKGILNEVLDDNPKLKQIFEQENARPGLVVASGGQQQNGLGLSIQVPDQMLLPQIELATPNKILFDKWSDVRRERASLESPKSSRAAQRNCGTLGDVSLAKLKNAFTGLSDSGNSVYPEQLRQLCVDAGIPTASALGLELLDRLLNGCARDKRLQFEDFMSTVASFCNIN